ncbi:hypothetical protein, partial [Vibrio gazogenes]|uniref:hypothetical protein n=1 Tax=Vibrio gazogenes TaxID=687 RepID=UPI0019689CBF
QNHVEYYVSQIANRTTNYDENKGKITLSRLKVTFYLQFFCRHLGVIAIDSKGMRKWNGEFT